MICQTKTVWGRASGCCPVRPILIAAQTLVLAVITNAAFASPQKEALVIGNATYQSIGALRNPVNDARATCAALGSLGFHTRCHYDVATRGELMAAIQNFTASLSEGAVVFVYYAGHAIEIEGQNYLIATGARLTDDAAVVSERLNVTYLMQELGRKKDLINIVILDACRNNPNTADSRLTEALAKITEVPESTVVFYATATNGLALDGGVEEHGILTKNLLDNIGNPGTLDDLFHEVSQGVQRDARSIGFTQRPELYTNVAEAFCLVRCTDMEQVQAAGREAAADAALERTKNVALTDTVKKTEAELQAARKIIRPIDVPPAN